MIPLDQRRLWQRLHFLGERLRLAHYPALALVAIGVAIPAISGGTFTWLAVALPISFGFYGLVPEEKCRWKARPD